MNTNDTAAAAAVDAGAAGQAQPGAEGDAAAAAQLPAGEGAAAAEGAAEEAPAPKTSRDAIYARHREQRTAAEAEDPDRLAAVQALAGVAPEPGEAEGGAAAVAGGEKSQDEKPLALDKRTHKLNVEGQEVEVTEDQILEAGRRSLQKDHSADLRLRQAASAQQLAAETLAEAQRIRDSALKDSGRLPSSGAGPDDASSRLSDKDAGERTEAIAKAGASQARDVLFDEGDPEKAVQVIVATSRKTVVEATNQMFLREFSEIASDPALFQRAVTMMNAERARNSDFASFPVIATRIGNQLRAEMLGSQVQKPAGEAAERQEQQEQAPGTARSRTENKLRLPAVPSRAAAKTPDARPAAPKRQTPSEIVQAMKVARGQVRPT
jgi:hypothetical protein